jgi:hypothetical protein
MLMTPAIAAGVRLGEVVRERRFGDYYAVP